MGAIRKNRSPEPKFETNRERSFFTVAFPVHPKAQQATQQTGSRLESQLESQLESLPLAVLNQLTSGSKGKSELATALKQKQVSGQLHIVIRQLLGHGLVERTIPDRPNSRLQKYRLTSKGRTMTDKDSRSV